MLDFLISTAHAQDAAASPSALSSFLPLILIFVVFYFLIIRPQQKKYKQHQAMINAVERGDDVITGGGIHGKVVRVEEGGKVRVKIADNVEILVEQSTLTNVLNKPGAADLNAEKKKAANDNK